MIDENSRLQLLSSSCTQKHMHMHKFEPTYTYTPENIFDHICICAPYSLYLIFNFILLIKIFAYVYEVWCDILTHVCIK